MPQPVHNTPERHYFDWAATAIPEPAFSPGSFPWGNPSSLHSEGRKARDALEQARARCAAVLGVPPKQIYFTSGGTESNALVIYSVLLRKPSMTVLASAVEHSSVLANCAVLERMGRQTGIIAVEKDGRVSIPALERALEKYPRTRLTLIMGVNNETGAVTDMKSLVRVLRTREGPPVHVHCDLVQGIGKIPLDLRDWDVDSASLSAHKLGGPRGTGLLYLRKPLEVIYTGGGQEGGIRPGTENTFGALALAAALERRAAPGIVQEEYQKARARWKWLIGAFKTLKRCTLIPGDREQEDPRFSPWILQAAFEGIPGEVMVRALDDAGFAVSTGSACAIAGGERPVLAAMGVDNQKSFEGIRISQGWSTAMEEVELLFEAIKSILGFL
ncbi:MAG: cysteine desulfurase [Treponema sp.]|nr:cysteine desulfurase [Treponema sp.]